MRMSCSGRPQVIDAHAEASDAADAADAAAEGTDCRSEPSSLTSNRTGIMKFESLADEHNLANGAFELSRG